MSSSRDPVSSTLDGFKSSENSRFRPHHWLRSQAICTELALESKAPRSGLREEGCPIGPSRVRAGNISRKAMDLGERREALTHPCDRGPGMRLAPRLIKEAMGFPQISGLLDERLSCCMEGRGEDGASSHGGGNSCLRGDEGAATAVTMEKIIRATSWAGWWCPASHPIIFRSLWAQGVGWSTIHLSRRLGQLEEGGIIHL